MNAATQKRMVIHIGYPKCASTYLQRVVFPRLGNFSNFGNGRGPEITHGETAFLYHRDMDPGRYRSIVDQCMIPSSEPKPYRILSTENYVELPFLGFERNFGQVARVKGIDLTPYDHRNEVICENLFRTWPEAYILIVVREPLSWAVSRYDHWYRRDLIDGTLDSRLDALGESYDLLVQRYMEHFGPEHVRVVPYEWLNSAPERFLRAVTGFIDPEFASEIPNVRLNASPPSAAEVEYRRAQYRLNHLEGSGGWRGILARAAKGFLPAAKPYYNLRYSSNPQRSVVPEETARRLRPQLAVSNRRLEALTGLSLGELGYDVSLEPA